MYRETIEHPFSIPEPIKKHLDLTSGKDLGRIYELLPEKGVKRRKPALSKAPTAELVKLLAHPAAWFRETAQRLLIERHDTSAIPALKEMARSRPTGPGRVHALWTLDVLGGLGENDLLPAMTDGEAGVREQAARLAEARLRPGSELSVWLASSVYDHDPFVLFQVAFSLGGAKEKNALDALASLAQREAEAGRRDRWMRVAIESSLAGRAAALMDVLEQRDETFFRRRSGRVWLEELATLVGAENDPVQVRAVLSWFSGPNDDPGLTRTVALGLGRGLQRAGGSLRESLKGPAGSVLVPVLERAAETAKGNGPEETRIDAVRLLSIGPVDLALETLPDLLDARQPGTVQLAAIQTLAGLNDRRIGPLLLDRWRRLSPSVRGEAVEALFARPERLAALLDAVEAKTVAASDLDPGRVKQLLAHPSASVRDRAARLFGKATRADRAEVIARFRPALSLNGDRERGKAVFLKVCSTCHRSEGQGNDVGPSLATVTGRTPEDLLVHILDPNREVSANYVNYNVETTDGRVVTGLIAEESANAVTLKRAEGATDVVPRNRIESIASTGLSLMPEGLEQGLQPQGFADLIAYVRGILAGGQTAVR
jgi:putative heme-binding domain-containing protein